MRRLGDFIKKSYMLYISLQEDISKLFSRIQFIISLRSHWSWCVRRKRRSREDCWRGGYSQSLGQYGGENGHISMLKYDCRQCSCRVLWRRRHSVHSLYVYSSMAANVGRWCVTTIIFSASLSITVFLINTKFLSYSSLMFCEISRCQLYRRSQKFRLRGEQWEFWKTLLVLP